MLGTAARQLAAAHPGRHIRYLDGGFPFFPSFPILPHLSHGNARKFDVAVLFADPWTGRPLRGRARSPIGNWGYVGAAAGAILPCGGVRPLPRWDFGRLQPLLPDMLPDVAAPASFISALVDSPHVTRILIEPHLAARLGLGHRKLRLQGCGAERHDHHIHIEFR